MIPVDITPGAMSRMMTAEPLVLISWCGITSLFLIVSVWPGCSLIVWLTAGLAPSRAQMWQPLIWWLITSVLPAAGAARADATRTAARAAAAARAEMARFMISTFHSMAFGASLRPGRHASVFRLVSGGVFPLHCCVV